MRTRPLSLILFSPVLLALGARPAEGAKPFAPGPDGRQQTGFAEPSIYDLSGTYRESVDLFDLQYTLQQDDRGILTGSGRADAFVQGVDFNITFRITGAVKGSPAATRITFKMDGDGVASAGFESVPFRFIAVTRAEVTPGSPSRMVGRTTVKVCVPGAGCARETVEFDALVSDDGSWSIALGLEAGERLLTGRATVSTSGPAGLAGRSFEYQVTGRVARNGLARLRLTPVQGGRPLTLLVTADAAPGSPPVAREVLAVGGQLLGTKIKSRF